MKKALSYTSVFVVGFIACVLALKTMGDPSNLLPGADSRSKQAVLTALNTTPRPAPRTQGDSVVADAAAKLEPAIVAIHTTGKPVRQAASPFGNDPIFRRFFGGGGDGPPQVTQGAGSGVIISPDGYILTNNHVVADAATVKVTVGQGDNSKEYTARVIGTDSYSDIAVVKVNPTTPLQAADLGNSDGIRVGDWAIAVGNPLNIGTTVTLGIISAKDRHDVSDSGSKQLPATIQTDAAINPGNSGGALADINGRVVGINEAILSPTGSYIGIGLAIPINDAKRVAAQLIKSGKVSRPYLGIKYGSLKDIDDLNVRRQFALPLDSDVGVVVGTVYPNSPAAQAGLQEGDLILQADGEKITKTDQLNDIIQKKTIGSQLVLQVARKGKPQTTTVTLRERPTNFGETPQDQGQDQGQGQAPDDQQPANPFFP